jgi:hypothetical protein
MEYGGFFHMHSIERSAARSTSLLCTTKTYGSTNTGEKLSRSSSSLRSKTAQLSSHTVAPGYPMQLHELSHSYSVLLHKGSTLIK